MLRKYGFSPALTNWLRTHIREYDLLHIHGVFAHPTILAAASSGKIDVPYIIRPCGQLDSWPLRKSRYLKSAFLKLIGWRILNQAAAIHATSEMEATALKRLGIKSPIVTIPLGIDCTAPVSLDGVLPSGEFRKEYSDCDGKKVILFLSRIDVIKGLDLLFQATKELASKRKDFVLVIAGSGAPSFQEQVRGSDI